MKWGVIQLSETIYYIVTVKKKVRRLGEESVLIRIVKPCDLQDFLYAFSNDEDDIKIKQVEMYGE